MSTRVIIFLLIFFFPILVFGETISMSNLIKRDGIYFKKFSTTPFTGSVEDWKKNGQLKGIGKLVNGRKEGIWKHWHEETGNLWLKIEWENNYINGDLEHYDYGGLLCDVKTFKMGIEIEHRLIKSCF